MAGVFTGKTDVLLLEVTEVLVLGDEVELIDLELVLAWMGEEILGKKW